MTRLICLCTLVLLSCASAANAEVFTLKFASFVPASHGMSRWIDDCGPVLALEDLQGKAVRPPSRTVGKFMAMMGAKPVGLPPTAMAEGLQKGTIDGTLIDYGGAGLAFKLGPFLTDITEVYAYTSSFAMRTRLRLHWS